MPVGFRAFCHGAQGVWNPQDVGVDLLVYKREEGRTSLSVVWRDEEHAQARHAIDLERLDDVVRRKCTCVVALGL